MHLHAAAVSAPRPFFLPLSSSYSIHRQFRPIAPLCGRRAHPPAIQCSISQVHSYGTVDYEAKRGLRWSSLYRQICMMEDPTAGTAGVVDRWESEQRRLAKWELCRVAKELRKFKRFKLALEVYGWMAAQGARFTFTSSDQAIQLDLIAKVHGISLAEKYFSRVPDDLKDQRVYGALLNAYGKAKMKEKAESVVDTMKNKGYATAALPFNVMMTLYMNVGEYEKVDMIIGEMMERSVQLDLYSYNIWITKCAAVEDLGHMEHVLELMTSNRAINPNWTTYTTLASMYIKLGESEKALNCLRDAEFRLTGRNRVPFNYLIGLYAAIGKKEDIYRVWDLYKSNFHSILNLGYHAMISSLIKVQDTEGAEKIYEEWLSTTSSVDPRLGNLLMAFYVREGLLSEAKSVFDRLVEKGGIPNSNSWEILAEGYIFDKQLSEALSCLKEAASYEGVNDWRPKPENVANFLVLCKEQSDSEKMDMLMNVLESKGCLESEEYKSLVPERT